MSDAFDALRAPVPRVDPDPGFAARLRVRLERAVLDDAPTDQGGTMTQATAQEQVHSLTPYLAVSDARRALDWYVEVFGARRRSDPIVMPDGRIGHAELAIGDSVLMLADEFPEGGHVAPTAEAGPLLRVEVPDVDGAITRAGSGGGTVLSAASETGHGYSGTIRDPFGYRWMVSRAVPAGDGREGPRHGQLGYVTFAVPDDAAAREFYGAVLGWQFSPGRVERGWNVEGTGLPGAGLHGGQADVGPSMMYAVDDLDAALERVRERGGRAGQITEAPYGRTSDCIDNQGLAFSLWQP